MPNWVTAGFNLQLKDEQSGHEKLIAARNTILGLASQDKRLMGVRPNGQRYTTMHQIDVDQHRRYSGASMRILTAPWALPGVVHTSMTSIDRGRKKGICAGRLARPVRMPEDLNQWYVRKTKAKWFRLCICNGKWTMGSPRSER